MKKKSVKFKNYRVIIQENAPVGDDGLASEGLCAADGDIIWLHVKAKSPLDLLVHEVTHAIVHKHHLQELSSICNYDEKIVNALDEKFTSVACNVVHQLFVDEKKKTQQVFDKMEQLAKELALPKKADNRGIQSRKVRKKDSELQNSQDQIKNDLKKVEENK